MVLPHKTTKYCRFVGYHGIPLTVFAREAMIHFPIVPSTILSLAIPPNLSL
jgi:hypothetical protein